MKVLTLIFFALASLACAKTPTSGVPVSVTQVTTDIIGTDIVRVIQHNMELNPMVQFEIMKRPDFTVVNTLSITEVPYQGQVLNFKNSSGTFIEGVEIKSEHIQIDLEYFPLKGDALELSCNLPVKDSMFLSLSCARK